MERGWPPPAGGNAHSNPEANQSRPAFGAGQQSPPQGHSGLPPPPPSGPFPHFHQQPPSIANLTGISQSSPRQPGRPEGPQQAPPQGPQLPLPGFSQATGQPGQAERERDRAREETHIKEEEDRRQREQQERQRFEQAPPHQTQAAPPMHLHQPVAVGPRSVHGPNGLLANPGPPSQQSMGMGAPNGPANMFPGGPVQPTSQGQGPTMQQQMQASILVPGHPGAQQPGQQGQQTGQPSQSQGQGQQPILNDALSYLDQVKVQFADSPDVYNRFLDIMKDFKSGAIDTPGVIGRVSTLFNGNPELIQGFNTFLPPGYRIECGPGTDPNEIRVTTPMGSSILPMPQPQRLHPDQDGGQDALRPPNGTSTPQPGHSAPRALSPGGRPVPAAEAPYLRAIEAAQRQEQQQSMHQQEQRGVNSLQNAVSAATAAGGGLRAGISPRATPLPGQQDANPMADGQAGQAGMEKRGPVEFNHAISYVNKIKNRFASHPDIYKQFLEILQTYQRESKPIQDVYSQVTRLFDGAPDLLEDFKQFLPESAAQAKAAENARRQAEEGIMYSNMRGEQAYGSPVMSRETQIGTPNQGRNNLPPVGNFAPTPLGKDNNNKKRKERQGTAGSNIDGAIGPSAGKGGMYGAGAQPNKRVKQTHQPAAKGPNEAPPSSPTLAPRLPEPLPPTTSSAATPEELAFFERAKKTIGNKNVMNEFLKLCNLFSQDFIDRTALVHRAKQFIGGNPDLMKWFEDFVGYDEKDITIENRAREPMVPGGRISLSNCRGLGPSYRLLPKRERVKVCSGRDELCNAVLNDEWASHPTWASEDSGFIAHRKNLHEEALHRIEEERHDYDYNIEAANRTVQLLEPYAQQLRRMDLQQQRELVLPPGLGGQSEAIYKRTIMKLYGRDRGAEVIESLMATPYHVIPVLLNRLKERLESWKLAQREWEKVWREQTQKMFWRSLDHQAVGIKVNERRQFQTKALQGEMAVKFEEMKSSADKTKTDDLRGKPQIELGIDDGDVVVDATWLILSNAKTHDVSENPRLEPFLREFIPMLFGIDVDVFDRKLNEKIGGTPVNGDAGGDDNQSGAEDSASEKRGRKNGKTTLLRQAVDKGPRGRMGRKDREDSNTSASRQSTPDVASQVGDDSMAIDAVGTPTEEGAEKKAAVNAGPSRRWLDHPSIENDTGTKQIAPTEPQERHVFRLWANTPIFCFVRMFMTFYERLHRLKLAEPTCRETVKHAKMPKPAVDLGINDKLPSEFFEDIGPNANYYKQMMEKFVTVLGGDMEFVNDGVEECLRRFYLQDGYPMYQLEKMTQGLVRFGAQMVAQDGSKDRSWDILQLFKKDRMKNETSAQQIMDYRKAAEKLIGNADAYRIEWDDIKKTAKIFLVKHGDWFYKEDFPSDRDLEDQWRFYIASYSQTEPTEGVDRTLVTPVLLARNIHAMGADPNSDIFPPEIHDGGGEGVDSIIASDGSEAARAAVRLHSRLQNSDSDESLILRIAVGKFYRVFQPGTADSVYQLPSEREGGEDGVQSAEEATAERGAKMRERWVQFGDGVVGDVEAGEAGFAAVVEGEAGEGMEVDG
ncbi:Transcriptional regulatory protein sin3 [Saxophila tyrrhenica]|uniref:Transcriptional regulatory protein sin3 n=1 Tax=Saxophila tyrrhenica TaxID=1690608 RepID=A0AAV9PJ45_9PEZI|nr:Transcriptional regulatory protein sin3 [Saxophila tyrrhenica]